MRSCVTGSPIYSCPSFPQAQLIVSTETDSWISDSFKQARDRQDRVWPKKSSHVSIPSNSNKFIVFIQRILLGY